MQLIVFMGIQGSGKTTFYKENFANTHLRISLDILHTRHRERIIFDCCIATQTNVVIDNTNPFKKDRQRYIPLAKAEGYEIAGYYFAADLQKSIERNKNRPDKEIVPEAAVYGTLKKMERPSFAEGFNTLYYVSIDDNNRFNVHVWIDE